MSKSGSTLKGALRGVALAITLVSVLTFATVGYSVYQSYGVVTSPSFGSEVHRSVAWQDGVLMVSWTGTFPNEGLYPVQVSSYLNASSSSGYLGSADSGTATIAPSSTGGFNLSLSLDPFTAGGGAADRLFYNGSDVTLTVGLKTSLVPLAGLKVSGNSSTYIPAFMGNLTVVSALDGPSGLVLQLSFNNDEGAPVGYSMYASLARGGNSSVARGTVEPGGRGTTQLTFAGLVLPQGRYLATLHTLSFGGELTLPLVLEVT
ncbi:MAG: hypothetical protein JRN09_05215 [Nitrososphaerota archaeon]|nr:hypothetical protein [Nitrososphaerota archaeon]